MRNWLASGPLRNSAVTLPGHKTINTRYADFTAQLPALAEEAGVDADSMIFGDYAQLVSAWLRRRAA